MKACWHEGLSPGPLPTSRPPHSQGYMACALLMKLCLLSRVGVSPPHPTSFFLKTQFYFIYLPVKQFSTTWHVGS